MDWFDKIEIQNPINPKPKWKSKYRPDKHELMIVNKTPLKNIVKDTTILDQITLLVILINKIVVLAHQFIKLYLLFLYDKEEEFPMIDKDFVILIFKLITTRTDTRGRQCNSATLETLKELQSFFDKEFKDCIIDTDIVCSTKLNYILAYEAIDMVKNIENNISEHFTDHVNKFVNCTYNVKTEIEKINDMKNTYDEKKEFRRIFYAKIRAVKKDLLNLSPTLESEEKYHKWVKAQRKYIIPSEILEKDVVNYDVCVNPQDYIKPMIYINKQLDLLNDDIEDKYQKIKLFHPIPLRTNISPSYITLDTCALINICIDEDSIEYLNNVKSYADKIWDDNFKTDKKEFKRNGYSFHHMIATDGIGASILFMKIKADGKPIPKIMPYMAKQVKKLETVKYIEDIEITDAIRKKKVVTIDPNYGDLIYALMETPLYKNTIKDNDGKIIGEAFHNTIEFRYTQNQRRKEIGTKKYAKITENIKKTAQIEIGKKKGKKITKSVTEIETQLSDYNSKVCDYKKFKEYCKQKNNINRILFNHYLSKIYRKFKFNRYINTQKSESKMINNFKNKFGDSKDILVIIGDFDKKENMKGKEPAICKKLRKIFQRHGYEAYLINEYHTSKLCNCCEHENENFLMRKSRKPKCANKQNLVWGIVRCKNVKCKLIHNRDVNACKNMQKIVRSIMKGKGRPEKYNKPKNDFIHIKLEKAKTI